MVAAAVMKSRSMVAMVDTRYSREREWEVVEVQSESFGINCFSGKFGVRG